MANIQGLVLVTGPTGTIGKLVVQGLLARGAKLRLFVRDAEKAKQLFPEGNYEVAVGDVTKPETIEPALVGVERLILLTVSSPLQEEIERSISAAAKKAGVKQLVDISVYGANLSEPSNSLLRWHAYAENAIIASGVPFTILRPNLFLQNFARDDAGTIKSTGVFYRPTDPTTRISNIDVRDIADVAVTILTDPIDQHANQTYNLTGPEAQTYDEIAKIISEVIGKEVKAVYIDDVALHKAIAARGAPKFVGHMVRNLYQYYRSGLAAVVAKDIEIITGKPAHTTRQYFTDYKQLFTQ